MRYNELILEYVPNSVEEEAYWFNTKSNQTVDVNEPTMMSHAGHFLAFPTQYGFSVDELLKSDELFSGAKPFIKKEMDIDLLPKISEKFDGSPSIISFLENRGWVRVVIDGTELMLESNNLRLSVIAARYFFSKKPNLDYLIIDNKIRLGPEVAYYVLDGRRLDLFLKYGTIPSEKVREAVNWAIDTNIDKALPWSKKDQTNDDYKLIWVDIRKLMAAVTSDFRLDLDDPEGGPNVIKGRIEKAIDHLQQGGHMDPPLVSLGYNGIDFTDGRHRLVAAYRLGDKTAPIIVPKEQAKKIMELLK